LAATNKNLVSMKHILTLLLVTSFAFSYGQDSVRKNIAVDFKQIMNKFIGEQFPQFNVRHSDSTTFSNADLLNKVAFVNFWFESCPPCIAELEGFNNLFDTLKDNKDFIFVSFTFDSDSTIEKLVKKYDIKYKVIHIDRAECYRLNLNSGFPTSFVLDKKGIIKFAKAGGQIDKKRSTEEVMIGMYTKIYEQL
jgi:cytochrome oxidase Cu insertion factor (SCO1/SenC/PrrC family)